MNNEPVAWMQTYRGEPNNIAWTKKDLEELGECFEYDYIPLYTHPAKYTDAWWKEVDEFNKQLKEQKNG